MATTKLQYQSQALGKDRGSTWFDIGPWYPTLDASLDYVRLKKTKEPKLALEYRIVRRETVETVMWSDGGI